MRNRTKLLAAIAAGAVPIAFGAALVTAPTSAAATVGRDCHTITIDRTYGNVTTSGGGEATIGYDGLIMNTPETPAKVTARRDLHAPVPLSKITDLRYSTDRQPGATGNDQIVAAYKLGVDAQGDGTVDGVLVYEPLYNGTVTADEQVHNALGAGGTGKWWYSAEPGNKQTLSTFAEWTAGTGAVPFPQPEARWFAVEQGTWNSGAITLVNDVKFAGAGVCKQVEFCVPPPTTPPTGSPTVTPPTSSPTASPTTSTPTRPTSPPITTRPTRPPTSSPVPTDPTPTATIPPPGGGVGSGTGTGGDLALTGSTAAYTAGGAVALLAGGAVLLYLVRARRTRYVA